MRLYKPETETYGNLFTLSSAFQKDFLAPHGGDSVEAMPEIMLVFVVTDAA